MHFNVCALKVSIHKLKGHLTGAKVEFQQQHLRRNRIVNQHYQKSDHEGCYKPKYQTFVLNRQNINKAIPRQSTFTFSIKLQNKLFSAKYELFFSY